MHHTENKKMQAESDKEQKNTKMLRNTPLPAIHRIQEEKIKSMSFISWSIESISRYVEVGNSRSRQIVHNHS